MEFKVDHTDLEKMIMNDDLDTLSVMLALYLYAGGMDVERIVPPLEDAEEHMFREILRRSGYGHGGKEI